MLVDLASATRSNGESLGALGVKTVSVDMGEGGAIVGVGIGGGVDVGVLFGKDGAGVEVRGGGGGVAVVLGAEGVPVVGIFGPDFGVGVSPRAVSNIAPTLSAVPDLDGSLRILLIFDLYDLIRLSYCFNNVS